MINKVLGTLAVTTAAIASMSFATPAEARSGGYYNGYDGGYYQQVRDDRRNYRRGDYYRGDRYDRRDRRDSRRYNNDRRYRGCDRGTGGTIIGAIAGGLLGNEVAGRGDKTVGTIIGGAAGALAGRAIDRDC
ncbi:glycine zipper 2TM domain-containing protein [Parasphingorhabdus sp.]|uniref:glycine zipper 2TM domain-containing protein n=1 Tax=Parasphingorhabdus sp. TaxID=2709688 RepID=UPI002F922B88